MRKSPRLGKRDDRLDFNTCVVVRAVDAGFRAAVRLLGVPLMAALSTETGIGR